MILLKLENDEEITGTYLPLELALRMAYWCDGSVGDQLHNFIKKKYPSVLKKMIKTKLLLKITLKKIMRMKMTI